MQNTHNNKIAKEKSILTRLASQPMPGTKVKMLNKNETTIAMTVMTKPWRECQVMYESSFCVKYGINAKTPR